MIEDLGLARFGLGDERLVQNVEDILANFLEFGLNLLAIIADGANMLVGTLRFFLLFNGRDYAPRGTSSSDNVLVGDREKVPFVNGELSTELQRVRDREMISVSASSPQLHIRWQPLSCM